MQSFRGFQAQDAGDLSLENVVANIMRRDAPFLQGATHT